MTHPSQSRRIFLQQAVTFSLAGPGILSAAVDVEEAAELAHAEIWKRFVDHRFEVLLHYAGLNGEVHLPTAEECHEAKPNGMSWSTPIEDGPFFGGLFLDGLCNRWRVRRDEESANKARRIATGLMKLAELSPLPGFIPRGVGADDRSFYPASSEDQVFPWFYGLWSYLRTGLPANEERIRIVKKLKETALALEHHGWQVPCASLKFGYRGAFTRPHAHDAARLLFLLRAMHQLTQDDRWLKQYRERLDERIGENMLARRDIVAGGLEFAAPPGGTTRVWTHSMSQAALRALADTEDDPASEEAFRSGLLASAQRAVAHLNQAEQYNRENAMPFDINWRFLNATWKPQPTCDDAIALGRAQLPLWAEHNPRSPWEDDTMREPLFAAWMIRLVNDADLNRLHHQHINDLMKRYDWTGLYTASFFIAVNLHYESARTLAF